MASLPITVEVEAWFRLIEPSGTALPIRVSLRYDPADPYAVSMLFHVESIDGENVHWAFARELLKAGLDSLAGFGDVRIWPWTSPGNKYVALALSTDKESALFQMPRDVVTGFVRRTYVVVPEDCEPQHLGLNDPAINQFLDDDKQ